MRYPHPSDGAILAINYPDLLNRITSATIRSRADLDTIGMAIEEMAIDEGYAGAVLAGGPRSSLHCAVCAQSTPRLYYASDRQQQRAAGAVAVLVYETTVDPAGAPTYIA